MLNLKGQQRVVPLFIPVIYSRNTADLTIYSQLYDTIDYILLL